MQEQSAPSILRTFETTPAQRNSFVDNVMQAIDIGNVSALQVLVQVKSLADIINTFTEKNPEKNKRSDVAFNLAAQALNDAQAHGSKPFELYGATIKQQEVGTVYDFSTCEDPELPKLQAAFDAAKAALDDRKEFLKKLPAAGVETLDNDNGELVKIYPPSKRSTTSVVISLNK